MWRWLAALLLLAGSAVAEERRLVLPHQGIERQVLLLVPDTAGPRPLLLALQGLNQGTTGLRQSWTMDAVAAREGLLMAYPEPLPGGWSYHPSRAVPLPGGAGAVDDLGFLAMLLDRLVAEGLADPARRYAVGSSRGGLMAWALGCRMADRLAGIAPLITPMTDPQLADCAPARALPVLALGGTEDVVQRYEGWIYDTYRQASMPETLEFWRRRLGCTGQVGEAVPQRGHSPATRVLRVDWTGCAAGGALRLFRVAGGGHVFPTLAEPANEAGRARNRDIETAEEVWRFFRANAPR